MSPDLFLSRDARPPAELQGAAFYFDFAPVFERGEKWRSNPERVALMCKNRVHAVAPGERMIPQPGGFFLLMQTRAGPAGEALANDVNLALLELFFGTDALTARLFRAVPYSEIVAAGLAGPADAGGAANSMPTTPETKSDGACPAERNAARPGAPSVIRFEPGFMPMLNLQRDAPAIFLCVAVNRRDGQTLFGAAALKGCAPKDRPGVDVAMLEYSLGISRQIVQTKFPAAICTCVGYETLAWSKGRQLFQTALRKIGEAPFLIVKIDDVPSGTTDSRLAEVVALVRPFVKRVFLQLPNSDIGLMQSGNIGAAGLCVSLPAQATPRPS